MFDKILKKDSRLTGMNSNIFFRGWEFKDCGSQIILLLIFNHV